MLPPEPLPKQIWVEIKTTGDGFPSGDEMDSRWDLEDQIDKRGIGDTLGGGSGGGWMDFNFACDDIDVSFQAFIKLLDEYGVLDRAEVEITRFRRDETLDCIDENDFQPGDALIFQYHDGDYGAGLVMARGEEHPWHEKILLGVLNYKSPAQPTKSVFEQRQWFITTREWNRGEPYFVWMDGCGVELFQRVERIELKETDIRRCQFHVDWELLAEMVEIERQRLT